MTSWIRSKRVMRDALALAGAPTALSEAKKKIDASLGNRNLKALRHWTDVWFKLHQLQLGDACR